MKKILALLAASLSVAACIYPYDPELDEAPEGVLSVDANICIGGTSTVRLGTLISMWDRSGSGWVDLYGAHVWVEDEAGNTYEGKPGYPDMVYGINYMMGLPFFTIDTENAPLDRRYRLRIDALGESYESDWSECIDPPVIREIGFVADEEKVTVNVSVDGGESGTGYVLLTYEEDWMFHVDYFPSYVVVHDEEADTWNVMEGSSDFSKYWCFRSTKSNRTVPVDYTGRTEEGFTDFPLLSFARKDNRNHRRYCVSVKASTISRETYRFIHNLDENSEGGDNLFTPNPGEIAGNLHCESNPEKSVLGYAIFSRAATRRAYLGNDFYIPIPAYPLLYPLPDNYGYLYQSGFLPLEEHLGEYDTTKEGPYGWGPKYCYDCTAAGGTLEKPDFWSETE